MTVAELYQEIQEIQKLTGQPHLIHKIAVLGSHRGCGSTHVAVSLTCELNILGYHGIYIDSAKSVLCHGNHDGLQIFKQKTDIIITKAFRAYPTTVTVYSLIFQRMLYRYTTLALMCATRKYMTWISYYMYVTAAFGI